MALAKVPAAVLDLALLLLAAAASLPLYLAAAVCILVTGRWPRWALTWFEVILRWFMRASAFQYLLVDRYPPLVDRRGDAFPVTFEVALPTSTARWRPLFAWILVLPQLASLVVVYAAIFLMASLAMFAILFSARIPVNIFEFIVQALAFHARVLVYALAITDRYPGFAVEVDLSTAT
jgi:hypothetical protein